jgi:hypothetical protein
MSNILEMENLDTNDILVDMPIPKKFLVVIKSKIKNQQLMLLILYQKLRLFRVKKYLKTVKEYRDVYGSLKERDDIEVDIKNLYEIEKK